MDSPVDRIKAALDKKNNTVVEANTQPTAAMDTSITKLYRWHPYKQQLKLKLLLD